MKDYLFILLNIFMLLPCFQGTGLTGMKLVEEPHTVSLPLEYLVQYVLNVYFGYHKMQIYLWDIVPGR